MRRKSADGVGPEKLIGRTSHSRGDEEPGEYDAKKQQYEHFLPWQLVEIW